MRRAAGYYSELNRQQEADTCKAYQYKFEKNYGEAGQLFSKWPEYVEQARDCYWEGQLWAELLKLEGSIPKADTALARFMLAAKDNREQLTAFTELLASSLQAGVMPNAISGQWQNGISEYSRRILAVAENELSKKDWSRIGMVFEGLHDQSYPGILDAQAHCYYNAGDFRNAIRCWDELAGTTHREYYLAKAQTQPYPLNLEWWSKAGEDEKVYALWQAEGGIENPGTARVCTLIAPLLETRERYWDATLMRIRIPETQPDAVVSLLQRIGQYSLGMVKNLDEAKAIMPYLASREQWDYLSTFMQKIFRAIDSEQTKNELRYDVIRRLGSAKVSDKLMDPSVTEALYRVALSPILKSKDWEGHINMEKQLGPAVEKLGFDISLRYYGQLIDEDQRVPIRDFARARWLANATEKVDFLRLKGKGDEERTVRLRSEISRRKRDWSISLSKGTSKQKQASSRHEPTRTPSPIRGLPSNIAVQEADGQWRFVVEPIEFTLYQSQHILTLQDLSVNRVKFNIATQEITSSDMEVLQESTPDGRIFSIPAWHIGGKISNTGEESGIELAFPELHEPLVIRL